MSSERYEHFTETQDTKKDSEENNLPCEKEENRESDVKRHRDNVDKTQGLGWKRCN